jgi:hypothetical protein
MTVQEATATATIGKGARIQLPLLNWVQDGDMVLDFKPGQPWFDGAMERAKLADGWRVVNFNTRFNHIKISGRDYIFLRPKTTQL